jgi:multidrug efflux pump subunit AcrA (membrane-fusion protein)
MLNISPNKIKITSDAVSSLKRVHLNDKKSVLTRVLLGSFFFMVIVVFLPWTQNIRALGNVTALKPEQRPQTIHSIIAGRIEKWFVQEGDFVSKGDTILYISEVKEDYLDPNLLTRTQEQLEVKELSVKSYMEKIKALDNQIDALSQTSQLKWEQAKNKLKQSRLKVVSDSMDYEAAIINYSIAETQLKRMESLYEQDLKSLTDLEKRKLTAQKMYASKISAENKLLSSRNEFINAQVEITSVRQQYRDEIAKAESNKYSALSNMYDAEATVTKLQNQYMNYSVRNDMYYIVAPQDGFITKSIQTGLGETIKEGEPIINIMPSNYDLAVEMYVKPIDLPLIQKGRHVRIQFDGWPAIIFSGWPNTSVGTYGGTVFAIDNFISDNGKYRVLVVPDSSEHTWPTALRVGAGTSNFALLKDVPIWYELWRNINGFPPDYYTKTNTTNAPKKDEKK